MIAEAQSLPAARPVARILSDITHVLQSAEDDEQRHRHVLEQLGRLVPYDYCALLLARSGGDHALLVLPEPERDRQASLRADLDRLLCLLADEPGGDRPARRAESGVRFRWQSHLAVPLIGLDQVIGILAVGRLTPDPYGEEDLALVSIVASQLAAYQAALADLATRRQAEESLRSLAAASELRVATLEELDRLKEEFIAIASHDLKSPLTSIRGYAQLLLRRVRDPAPNLEQIAQGLAVIDAQTAAMARLLDSLLDASRIQSGALPLWTMPCELGECLATVLARLSPQERARVDVALPDAPLAGDWEQKRVEQVLANLVGNALKYSPESERVGVVVERRPGEIEVAVGDRGMGIPPEELPRLFERFHRTPQAHASGLPGTGLGLYICRGIVAAHGGRLWAESPGAGQGATFRFTLPDRPPKDGDPEMPRV